MQHLLTHLGINRSYLFLNTFVYPIFGQYNGLLPIIAQHPASPIAQHRKKLFDYVVDAQRPATGRSPSVAPRRSRWPVGSRAHGGTADPDNLHLADASVISPNLHMVGVLHPGGAGKGGAVSAIIASFNAAINHVHQWVAADPTWLPIDPGAVRATTPYTYSSATRSRSATFRTASPWRLGRGSTSSNRRDGQTAIQIFSEDGKYNNDGHDADVPRQHRGHQRRLQRRRRRCRVGATAARPQGLRPRSGCHVRRAAARRQAGFRVARFHVVRVEVLTVVRHRTDLPGPARPAQHPRPGRSAIARRSVHDAGARPATTASTCSRSSERQGSPAGTRSCACCPSTRWPTTRPRPPRRSTAPAVRALYTEAVRLSRPQVLLFVGPLVAATAHPRRRRPGRRSSR